MKLSELVAAKRINLDLKSTTKDGVLEELVKLLRLSNPAREALLKTLCAREELGSTGVGRGIAIPHCRSLVVSKVTVAVGRSKKGIGYKSLDKKRAYLFFLIVAPESSSGFHLQVLARIAKILKNSAFRKKLMGASNKEVLYETIIQTDEES